MTSINKMKMARALFQKNYIQAEKTFFGLKTNCIYTATHSPVVGSTLEFDLSNGKKAQRILSADANVLDDALRSVGRPETSENGSFLLQLCYAKDHCFAAAQLLQYVNFDYSPVSEVRIAEGAEAEKLLRFFVK